MNKKIASLLGSLCLLSGSGMLQASQDNLPDGYDRYLTYIANGVSSTTVPHPEVPGCDGLMCDGTYFQTEIMQRDAATIDALEAQAADFYLTRFGVDVHDPANAGRILFRRFMLDPRLEYRAYHVSGHKAPSEGFVVRDGGWVMITLDPAGYTLGGEFAGTTVAPGTMFFYGEYNIAINKRGRGHRRSGEDEHHGGRHIRPMVISYRAGSPVEANQAGNVSFSCELSDKPLTQNFPTGVDGLAQGFGGPLAPDANGNIQANIRNALTFNDNGGI